MSGMPKIGEGLQRPRVAFGPVTPGWGSWEWVGQEIATALSRSLPVTTYAHGELPDCDVLVVVKHPQTLALLPRASRPPAAIYAPIDFYDSRDSLAAHESLLRRCACLVAHCQRLQEPLEEYGRVAILDHHIRFAGRQLQPYRQAGPILWTGVHSNLPHLIEWVNRHPLPAELVVLSNFPKSWLDHFAAAQLGFDPRQDVRLERWSSESHLQWLQTARAALDIKGADFSQLHKPPTKAVDFVAAGLPVAVNPSSSSAEYLLGQGLQVADPREAERWLSRDYWQQTRHCGQRLRRQLNRGQVAQRWLDLILEVWNERQGEKAARRAGSAYLPPHLDPIRSRPS